MNTPIETNRSPFCPVCRKNLSVIQNNVLVITEKHSYCSKSCHQIAKEPNSTYQLSSAFSGRKTIRRSKMLKAS